MFASLFKADNRVIMLDPWYLPRWVVLLMDTVFIGLSALLVHLIISGTTISYYDVITPLQQALVVIFVNLGFYYFTRTYLGLIRHSTLADIIKLLVSALLTGLSVIIFNIIYEVVVGTKVFLTIAVVFYVLLSFTLMLLFRIAIKENHLRSLDIEELLDRQPIKIDNGLIDFRLKNQIILVTGGAGSIGSEIVRQLANFHPKLIVILDQAESLLYEMELYLKEYYPDLPYIIELADICNVNRMSLLFQKYDFNIIYHAAGYKHVPLIERNPHEGIFVNIQGTVNLANQAVSYKVDKFVMVSTDKAVNPTNVMGATKRVAEMYVQSLQSEKGVHTGFITTRFGNVMGSSGSVIPHFRKQIERGGPVTVTHKNIIRYFMTIPEACQLVLQAGSMGNGGEIYIFDMGEPVKILDLAERMIRLAGFEPYDDIEIKITGLRPGEKLYEELLTNSSKTLPTHHPKIMISKSPIGEFKDIKKNVNELIKKATRGEDVAMVELLKVMVPEFKSKNSKFEILDQPQTDKIA